MPALVTVSRVYPTYGTRFMRKSGKPDFDGIHVFRLCKIKDVDGTGMEALIA